MGQKAENSAVTNVDNVGTVQNHFQVRCCLGYG